MKRRTLIICSLLALTSCRHAKKNTFYLLFDRVDGLSEGSPVETRGMTIGSIYDMDLYKDKVLVTVKIESKYKIPQGSAVKRDGSFLGGDCAIQIDLSNNPGNYANGDTILALPERDSNTAAQPLKSLFQGIHRLLHSDSSYLDTLHKK